MIPFAGWIEPWLLRKQAYWSIRSLLHRFVFHGRRIRYALATGARETSLGVSIVGGFLRGAFAMTALAAGLATSLQYVLGPMVGGPLSTEAADAYVSLLTTVAS